MTCKIPELLLRRFVVPLLVAGALAAIGAPA
jgi:hypothetical protein